MGWLDRLTGRKNVAPEDDLPEGFETLLEQGTRYVVVAMALAMLSARKKRSEQLIAEKTASGIDGETAKAQVDEFLLSDIYLKPVIYPVTMLVAEFSRQLSHHAGKSFDHLAVLGIVGLLVQVFNLRDLARTSAPALLKIRDKGESELIQLFGTARSETLVLKYATAGLTAGMVVGNRMAQDFLTQIQKDDDPAPSEPVIALFETHVLARGRSQDATTGFDIEPTTYVPNVSKWLAGEEAEVLTVTAKAPETRPW